MQSGDLVFGKKEGKKEGRDGRVKRRKGGRGEEEEEWRGREEVKGG